MNSASAKAWIYRLGLEPHPEGGWFRETYRAAGRFGDRNHSTAIYFLLEGAQVSALHRITSDEVWHFYDGDPLDIHVLGHGAIPLDRDHPQAVVPAHAWFGSRLRDGLGYALVGCTVSPGFDFADFEMGRRADLLSRFPAERDTILQLTRA